MHDIASLCGTHTVPENSEHPMNLVLKRFNFVPSGCVAEIGGVTDGGTLGSSLETFVPDAIHSIIRKDREQAKMLRSGFIVKTLDDGA